MPTLQAVQFRPALITQFRTELSATVSVGMVKRFPDKAKLGYPFEVGAYCNMLRVEAVRVNE
jgi:hypothetical protein